MGKDQYLVIFHYFGGNFYFGGGGGWGAGRCTIIPCAFEISRKLANSLSS